MEVASHAVGGTALIAPGRAARVAHRRVQLAAGLLVAGAALFLVGASTPSLADAWDAVEEWAFYLAGAYMLLGGLAFLAFWGALLRGGLTGRARCLVIVLGLVMVVAIAGIPARGQRRFRAARPGRAVPRPAK